MNVTVSSHVTLCNMADRYTYFDEISASMLGEEV
jgi:hypothetical protein